MAMEGGRTIPLVRGPLGLALALAVGPSCQVERSADAFHRLEVLGRELAGAKGLITARSTRHAALVQTRGGAAARCWKRCFWSRCKTPAIRPVALKQNDGNNNFSKFNLKKCIPGVLTTP